MILRELNKNPKYNRLLNYASWASLEHKFLYVETPKAACTKIKQCLQQLCGLSLPPKGKMPNLHTRDLSEIIFVKKLADYNETEQAYLLNSKDIFRFCFVRNPYSRIFSAYKNKIFNDDPQYLHLHSKIRKDATRLSNNKISFIDFALFITSDKKGSNDHHWGHQHLLLYDNEINYSFIGKFEFFTKDFKFVLKKLKAEKDVIRTIPDKINETPVVGGGLSSYNYELAEIVYQKYRFDFERYNYEKTSWL